IPMSCAAPAWVKCRCRMVRSILTTSPALIRCSPASVRPRSANTLPEPGSISRAFLFGISHLAAQLFEPLPDQVHFRLRRRDPNFRLLLEGVDHVDQVPNGDGVDGAPGSTFIIRNN